MGFRGQFARRRSSRSPLMRSAGRRRRLARRAREAPAQQSRRRYGANGFASVPRTMPPLLNKEEKSASYGGCRTGSEGRWATVFSRQCDRGSIRPRAVALVRITSCMPQPRISCLRRLRPMARWRFPRQSVKRARNGAAANLVSNSASRPPASEVDRASRPAPIPRPQPPKVRATPTPSRD
jgi:hypothetical protein